jgi:RNA polymerase sigma factor (TIGR02999 family)
MAEVEPITLILQQFADGDRTALDRLMPLVYAELHRLAEGQFRRERPGQTLQPTALIHEVYMRLAGAGQPDYRNRAHFLAIAARSMRQILTEKYRARTAGKRGGGQSRFSLDESIDAAVERPDSFIAIDDALRELERQDPNKARLIEMRFFAGMTAEESAVALDLSVDSVRGQLRMAQAWLQRELRQPPA